VEFIDVSKAKANLPRLLDRVARGERITITRGGIPIAVIVPPEWHPGRRVGDVISELQAFGRGRKLRGVSSRALIESGRR
jgi:prevent-host-death family protein